MMKKKGYLCSTCFSWCTTLPCALVLGVIVSSVYVYCLILRLVAMCHVPSSAIFSHYGMCCLLRTPLRLAVARTQPCSDLATTEISLDVIILAEFVVEGHNDLCLIGPMG